MGTLHHGDHLANDQANNCGSRKPLWLHSFSPNVATGSKWVQVAAAAWCLSYAAGLKQLCWLCSLKLIQLAAAAANPTSCPCMGVSQGRKVKGLSLGLWARHSVSYWVLTCTTLSEYKDSLWDYIFSALCSCAFFHLKIIFLSPLALVSFVALENFLQKTVHSL